jgi:hypothetical protein
VDACGGSLAYQYHYLAWNPGKIKKFDKREKGEKDKEHYNKKLNSDTE